ncbi:hypothetical protein [Nostoc sp. C052]|nr:hypothetical protein [Nostoc sp. C052]
MSIVRYSLTQSNQQKSAGILVFEEMGEIAADLVISTKTFKIPNLRII